MASAKDIIVKPIPSQAAREFVKRFHYSGKVVNSQLHLGCFLNGVLGGVMQFGPSLDKRKIQGLVRNTGWNDFIELNRMAFSDLLPKNAESRCISVAMRLIKKYYPNIKWVISFADGCQCGDGTIYRASGFKLTGISKNNTIYKNEDGESVTNIGICSGGYKGKKYSTFSFFLREHPEFKPVAGFMLRYIYFIDKNKEKDLTVPVMSFTMIDEMNARMYKGVKGANASIVQEKNGIVPDADGGVIPTCSHQDSQV